MKKYMKFKYQNGECQVTYAVNGLSILVRGRGISETAKAVSEIVNDICRIEVL